MTASPARTGTAGRAAMLAMLATPAFGAAGLAAPAPEVTEVRVVRSGPSETPMHSPRGIAIHAAQGEVLLANSGQHRIEVFDLEGRRRGQFVHRVRTAEGELREGIPVALAVDGAGRVLVADNLATYVDVLDFRGRSVARMDLGAPAPGCPPARRATALAVTPAGEILVATAGETGRVHRFDASYRPLGCWGEPGTGPGSLSGITGLAVLPDGRVVVTCMWTRHTVQVFTPEGRFLHGFGEHEVGPGNFSLPSGVAVTDDGRIWVADEIRQVIQVFDSAGRFLGMVGGGGVAPGQFLYPSALASDGKACIAVTERVGNRFQLLQVRQAAP